MPKIAQLIRRAANHGFFVAIDLKSGYWQVPLHPQSCKYTAFRTAEGLYEFVVMPFGLISAPATFQQLMDMIFEDITEQGVSAYLDDMLIHAKTFEEGMRLSREVLVRLRNAGLTMNLKNSNFFPSSVVYSGHVLSKGTIRLDKRKIEALRKMPRPLNVIDVRGLINLLRFYQSFIPKFAQLMEPIYDILRKYHNKRAINQRTPVDWTNEQREHFEKGIDALVTAVLTVPLPSDEFLVETDASEIAIAGILYCKRETSWEPVEFMSKTLNPTQRNWSTTEREAWAIISDVNKFDCYVKGREFIVHTDNASLQ